MLKDSLEFNRGNWNPIDDLLSRHLQENRDKYEFMKDPGVDAIGFTAPTRLLDREDIIVELYSRTGHRKHPYLVQITIKGSEENVYVPDLPSLLELLSLISAAFNTKV